MIREPSPEGAKLRESISLRRWRFQNGTDRNAPPCETMWSDVVLPHFSNAEPDSGWYETEVDVPDEWLAKRLYIDVSNLCYDAVVWINGKFQGEITGPCGRLDTGLAEPGPVKIRLWVTRWWVGTENRRCTDPIRDVIISRRGDEHQLRMSTRAGLGKASLQAVPYDLEIENVRVETSYRRRELTVTVDYLQSSVVSGLHLAASVSEEDGSQAGLPSTSIVADYPGFLPSRQTRTMVIPWCDARLWAVGAPYLYLLRVQAYDSRGAVIDAYRDVTFGFREIWTEGRDLLLNGEPLKLRQGYFITTVPMMLLFESMGVNTMAVQPNGGPWYSPQSGILPDSPMQAASRELLDEADRRGFAVLMPAPSVNSIEEHVHRPDVQEQYKRYFRVWLKDLDRQNRPSILMWCPSMNTSNNHDPEKIGRKLAGPLTDAEDYSEWFKKGIYSRIDEVIRSVDSTRLIYHHQGGQSGDVEATNLYLNLLPLQEREDFLSSWAEHGEKPWMGIEFGTPFSANFFKWYSVPLFTEYCAIYLGDSAYALEQDDYVEASLNAAREPVEDKRLWDRRFAGSRRMDLTKTGDWTGYYKLQDLFIRSTNKSWRAFGLNCGLFPWFFAEGLGAPEDKAGRLGQLNLTTEEVRAKTPPAWANTLYHGWRDTLQPLLVFIGGRQDQFTEKGHTFVAGERVEKSVITIWDGPGDRHVTVNWEIHVGDRVESFGDRITALKAGTVTRIPVTFVAPQVERRTRAEIAMTAYDCGTGMIVCRDAFEISLLPAKAALRPLSAKWAVCDPRGETLDMLHQLGADMPRMPLSALTGGDALEGLDVLVIGRRALDDCRDTSSLIQLMIEQIGRGLRVIVFEQGADVLESLGLYAEDVVPRYTYPRAGLHPMLECVEAEDLVNWRGEGSLLPPKEARRQKGKYETPQWGNRGSVASVVIKSPHRGAFLPIVDCEFDLAYSPLLQWRHGRGTAVFCQLDVTGRIDIEPVARRLAVNILHYLDSNDLVFQEKELLFIGSDQTGFAYVESLGFECRRGSLADLAADRAADSIVVVGRGSLAHDPATSSLLCSYARAGGTVVVLPHSRDELESSGLPWPVRVETQVRARVCPDSIDQCDPLLVGIGPQLLHWRSFCSFDVFTRCPSASTDVLLDGLLLRTRHGDGSLVLVQLDWDAFEDGSYNLKLTRWNTMKLYRQLFTNLGARTNTASLRRDHPESSYPLYSAEYTREDVSLGSDEARFECDPYRYMPW